MSLQPVHLDDPIPAFLSRPQEARPLRLIQAPKAEERGELGVCWDGVKASFSAMGASVRLLGFAVAAAARIISARALERIALTAPPTAVVFGLGIVTGAGAPFVF